jgi:hypothetical protein
MRKLAVCLVLPLAALALTSCRPYSAASPFNRPVPANPKLVPNSQGIVDRLDGWGPVQQLEAGQADTPEDYFHPVYAARLRDPVYTVHCVRWTSSCEIEGHRVHIPSAARAAGGADGHMAVLQPDGWEYDFWQVRDKPPAGGTLVVSHGGRTRTNGDGLGSDATAAEFGLAAGIVGGDEILNLSDGQIDALPVPAWKKTILHALHHYGGYVGDTTGGHVSWGIQAESGSSFTSFGRADPWVSYAKRAGVERWSGLYYFDLDSGVDWTRYLKVLDPCVAQGSC